jgi:hypothetical protein
MPSLKAWLEGHVGLIKGWVGAQVLQVILQGCQMEEENVVRE